MELYPLEIYPTILREVVDLRLGRKLKMMSSITNDEMDRLRAQIQEEVLQEQRYWNKRMAKHGAKTSDLPAPPDA